LRPLTHLPQPHHGVTVQITVEDAIAAHYGQAFAEALGNHEAVEGVTVVKGQRRHDIEVSGQDGQQRNATWYKFLCHEFGNCVVTLELTDAYLDSHFPQTSYTQ